MDKRLIVPLAALLLITLPKPPVIPVGRSRPPICRDVMLPCMTTRPAPIPGGR